MEDKDIEFKAAMKERFLLLPKVVQQTITSVDVAQRMRALADSYKLHIDQWETLENEVQYTLLGIQPAEELQANIEKEVGVTPEVAKELTAKVSEIVFAPIREELERQLSHPKAQAEEKSGVETMRDQVLTNEASVKAPPVQPATPPTAPPTGKVERAQISSNYAPETPSHERKNIDGDPYREQFA